MKKLKASQQVASVRSAAGPRLGPARGNPWRHGGQDIPWQPSGSHGGVSVTANAPQSAVVAMGLCKSFGDHVVLDGIELDVAEGTVFALLGPNGSGKTTTVQILSTLLPADAGTVRVAGHDLSSEPGLVRAAIGVTGQFSAVDNLLTGQENLVLMADLNHLDRAEGRRRAAGLLDRFELAGAARKMAATYSAGMRRRLDLAMTLVGEPRIIFLDEPTTGLDPRSRRTMWQIIRDLISRGVTIFLTTQYLEEADQLADRIAVLDRGKLVAEGTPDELKRLIPGGHIQLQFSDASGMGSAARVLREASRDEDALTLQVPYDGSARSLKALLDRLEEQAIPVGLSVHTPDLDDVFFALTGQPRTGQDSPR
jgi:ABC-2 type transport system ATP-binding protein